MNIQWKQPEFQLNLVGVEAVKNGIWPSFVFTVIRQKMSNPVGEVIGKVLRVDIFEITVHKEQSAYGVVKNGQTIADSYYPDAGKEKCSMPVDIYQQVMRVIENF